MSELNVDTINEQTAANGVTIDGVLIKDGKAGGQTLFAKEIDHFRLTVAKTTNGDITSDISRLSDSILAGEAVGTGMTLSSGIFSFPSTGYYLIKVSAAWRTAANDGCALQINATEDNSSYVKIGQVGFGKSNDGSNIDGSTYTEVLVKITDTSNEKVKFTLDSMSTGSELRAATSWNFTGFIFEKVGTI